MLGRVQRARVARVEDAHGRVKVVARDDAGGDVGAAKRVKLARQRAKEAVRKGKPVAVRLERRKLAVVALLEVLERLLEVAGKRHVLPLLEAVLLARDGAHKLVNVADAPPRVRRKAARALHAVLVQVGRAVGQVSREGRAPALLVARARVAPVAVRLELVETKNHKGLPLVELRGLKRHEDARVRGRRVARAHGRIERAHEPQVCEHRVLEVSRDAQDRADAQRVAAAAQLLGRQRKGSAAAARSAVPLPLARALLARVLRGRLDDAERLTEPLQPHDLPQRLFERLLNALGRQVAAVARDPGVLGPESPRALVKHRHARRHRSCPRRVQLNQEVLDALARQVVFAAIRGVLEPAELRHELAHLDRLFAATASPLALQSPSLSVALSVSVAVPVSLAAKRGVSFDVKAKVIVAMAAVIAVVKTVVAFQQRRFLCSARPRVGPPLCSTACSTCSTACPSLGGLCAKAGARVDRSNRRD